MLVGSVTDGVCCPERGVEESGVEAGTGCVLTVGSSSLRLAKSASLLC